MRNFFENISNLKNGKSSNFKIKMCVRQTLLSGLYSANRRTNNEENTFAAFLFSML
jgi:hypothetical protein